MSTRPDLDQAISAWLRADAPDHAPGRLLEDSRERVRRTPQGRPLWAAGKLRSIDRSAGLAIAAAAVLVVAIGYSLAPSFELVGAPPSALPSPAPVSPTPGASNGIRPGSHVLSSPQVRIHLTMPMGWEGDEMSIYRLPPSGWSGSLGLAVTPYDVSYVVTDVCTDESDVDFVRVGPTVDELTTALANQIGVQRSGPTDIMLGGYPTKKFELSLLPECPGPEGHGFWTDATLTYGFWLGHHEKGTVYIVDVNGEPLVITSQYGNRAAAADIVELEQITASIDLRPLAGPGTRTGIGPGGPLVGGGHHLTVDGIPLSFDVPPVEPARGWARYGSLRISKDTTGSQGAEAAIYWTVFPDGSSADPCGELGVLPAGVSTADLASVVSRAPGTELVSGPADVTVGGRPAKHVVLTVRQDLGCDPGYFFTFDPPPGGPGWWTTDEGDTIRVWVVDVDGRRLFIAGETTPQASPGLARELEAIVDSIRFE